MKHLITFCILILIEAYLLFFDADIKEWYVPSTVCGVVIGKSQSISEGKHTYMNEYVFIGTAQYGNVQVKVTPLAYFQAQEGDNVCYLISKDSITRSPLSYKIKAILIYIIGIGMLVTIFSWLVYRD